MCALKWWEQDFESKCGVQSFKWENMYIYYLTEEIEISCSAAPCQPRAPESDGRVLIQDRYPLRRNCPLWLKNDISVSSHQSGSQPAKIVYAGEDVARSYAPLAQRG